MGNLTNFLRYPGSKRRMLDFLAEHLPGRRHITGRFIEPFVGSGAVFFSLQPAIAVLGDANMELIELYKGILQSPSRVWQLYRSYPNTKLAYKKARKADPRTLTPLQRAARSLYLNRTCFKGMWRTNLRGQFNVGYGGQDRRWSIKRADLIAVSNLLRTASLQCSDFEELIDCASRRDYLFLDPPYRPGEREQLHEHYGAKQFSFNDHVRLAASLRRADARRARWGLTISDHPDILKLYRGFKRVAIPKGTGKRIGEITFESGEVFITNT